MTIKVPLDLPLLLTPTQ